MRRISTLAAATLITFAFAQPAFARSAFFVQLGNAASLEEAESRWSKLKEEYPAQLGNLEFSPRKVTPEAGKPPEYRLHAGPAKTRAHANRICSVMTAASVDCYLVETAMFEGEPSIPKETLASSSTPFTLAALPEKQEEEAKPDAPQAEATTPAEPAPAPVAEKAPEPVEPPAPVELAAPALAPVPKPEPAPEPQPTPMTIAEAAPAPAAPVEPQTETDVALPWLKGRVDVAEAIAVPVTSDNRPKPLVNVVSTTTPVEKGVRMEEGNWLRISGFASEQQAYDFSQTLRGRVDGKLNTRISRPLAARGGRKGASLFVGPLSSAHANDVCSYAQEVNPDLSCGSRSRDQGRDITQIARAEAQAGNYPSAAPSASAALSPAPISSAERRAAPINPTRFYAQLGSWKNEAEAIRRWESLQGAHGAVLKGLEPEVKRPARVSVYARPSVRLRTGPFPTRDSAERLCKDLSVRGVSCLVVPE